MSSVKVKNGWLLAKDFKQGQLPGDAYWATNTDGNSGIATVSLAVPSGTYLADGGCTATHYMTSDDSATGPTFAEAMAVFDYPGVPDQPPSNVLPYPSAVAAVPDMGATAITPTAPPSTSRLSVVLENGLRRDAWPRWGCACWSDCSRRRARAPSRRRSR